MAGNIYHSFDGTILTITSDSGTTAMDLKGEKGDTGARGPRGLPGKAGGGARIEDGVISDETTWSSSGIVDRFAELMGTNANPAVLDNPYPNFPLQITTTFESKQSGSGEPSPDNIRPIIGFDSVRLTRCGKNLINLTFAQSGLVIVQNADGTITATNNTGGNLTGARCEFTGILPAGTYTISKNDTNADVFLQTSSEDYSNNITTYTFNYDGVSYLRVLCSNIQNGSSVTYKIQLEVGSTATAYEPYRGDTYTADFGQTVYGGTLDWNTGVLTVEWGLISSYAGEALPDEWISDRDVYSTGATPTIGAQITYKLATPTTIQLTPQEIKAIKGINTLYSNAQELTVIGRVDTMYQLSKLAERVAALESR